jgi:hypothetical protein
MNAFRRLLPLALIVGLWPSTLWAQLTRVNTLNVGLELSGVHDSDVADEIRQRSAQGGIESGGYSSALIGTAGYTRDLRRKVRLNSSLMSSVRYYGASDRISPVSHSGSLSARIGVGRAGDITVSQTAAYSPSYLYQLFPSATPVVATAAVNAAPEYRVDESTSFSHATRVGVGVPFVFGAVLAVSADRARTEFYDRADGRPPMRVDTGRVGTSWNLGRRHSVSAEYQYREGDFGGGRAIDQRLSVGTTYTRPLSTTRQLSLRVTLAPSIFRPPAVATTTVNSQRVGIETSTSAGVNFTRWWSVNATYRRGLEYIGSLTQPIRTNNASLGIDGTLLGRLNLGISGGYSDGGSALTNSAPSDDLVTYTGSLRLAIPVTPSIAAYGRYLYYHYDLRGQAAIAPGLPSVFERRSVMFGVSLSARPIGR